METAFAPDLERGTGGGVPFHVFILYDEVESGRQAMALYESLLERVGRLVEVRLNLWKFQVLVVPRVRALATEQALEADLIILAVRARSGLSGDLKQWLDGVLRDKREGAAALALLMRANREEHGIGGPESDIVHLAQEHQIEVFTEHLEARERPSSRGDSVACLQEGAAVTHPGVDRIMVRDVFPHWGINE